MSRLNRLTTELVKLAAVIGFFVWLWEVLALIAPERMPS